MSIASLKHLAFVLKCKSTELELNTICNALIDTQRRFDKNFYGEIEKKSVKKGKTVTRRINPSKGRLKLIQNKIKRNIPTTR